MIVNIILILNYLFTDHIVGIEKMEPRKFVGNGSIERDIKATDVWFHAVDADSGKLLDRMHPDLRG